MLNKLDKIPIKILIETSTGQGTEMCYTIEKLAKFFNKFTVNKELSDRFGICLDTCHIFNAGYDIRTKKGVTDYLTEFDKLIGIENIKLIHLNDSRWSLGKRHDEHRGLQHGTIFKHNTNVLKEIKTFAIKNQIPIILETHGAGNNSDLSSYNNEIKLITKL
mgnify:CR=1 FL=1